MTRAPARTPFSSSNLVRVLSDLALVDAVEPGAGFAEQFAQWLSLNDAITLRATLAAPVTLAQPVGAAMPVVNLGVELSRVQASLVASIKSEAPPNDTLALDQASAYAPYRRYHAACQRDMAQAVRTLRNLVRAVLAKASPSLAKLAALDGAFESILSERESKSFAQLPALLEKRFERLHKLHQRPGALAAQPPGQPALWVASGDWLGQFSQELQAVLLAELDARLQPTQGLIDAFNNETTTPQ